MKPFTTLPVFQENNAIVVNSEKHKYTMTAHKGGRWNLAVATINEGRELATKTFATMQEAYIASINHYEAHNA